jgi:hypothetical protein
LVVDTAVFPETMEKSKTVGERSSISELDLAQALAWSSEKGKTFSSKTTSREI